MVKKKRKISKLGRKLKKKIIEEKEKIKEEARKRLSRRIVASFSVLFLVIILLIFLVILYNFSRVESGIAVFVSVYGYVAIFATAFLVDLIMQPIGPEIPLISGIIAGANIFYVILFTAVGSTLASITGYLLGRKYGAYGFRKLYNEKVYKKWRRKYRKNGRLVLAIAAVTPVPYVPVCWISGMFHMRKRSFFVFGILTRIIRILTVSFLIILIKGV